MQDPMYWIALRVKVEDAMLAAKGEAEMELYRSCSERIQAVQSHVEAQRLADELIPKGLPKTFRALNAHLYVSGGPGTRMTLHNLQLFVDDLRKAQKKRKVTLKLAQMRKLERGYHIHSTGFFAHSTHNPREQVLALVKIYKILRLI